MKKCRFQKKEGLKKFAEWYKQWYFQSKLPLQWL